VVCEGGPDGYGRSASTVWPRVLAHLLHESRRSDIDGVLIALPEGMPSQVSAICDALHGLVAEIYVAGPSYLDGCARRETLGHVPVGLLVGKPLSKWQEMQKVVFDRVGALLLLLVLMPVLALIAIAIKLDSEGPALFRQKRTGYNNLPFTCFKFRTMYQAAPVRLADGSEALQQTVRGDRRITRVGRFLRSSSLDELPQLLNVLRGEMSLVGPRPHAPNTMAGGRLFSDIVADYARRHRVRPGITGWAQVHGFRGETPDAESLERRVQHDLFYVQNWSLLLDLRILLRTALCILHDPAAF
jgi:exopolysaccharide biosynthesis polyprenyl glycosylphosphotransferase